MLGKQLDHLVYATKTFDQTTEWFEEMTGVKPSFGGYHKNQGTKNALVKMGPTAYLEILGIDENNNTVSGPRWMGIDLINKPQLSRWAIQSSDLKKDASILNEFNPKMGKIITGQRKKQNAELLKWEMILPLDSPPVELAPFAIDWGSSNHPASSLKNEVELVSINFFGQLAESYQNLFENLGITTKVKAGLVDKITATFNTSKGQFTL